MLDSQPNSYCETFAASYPRLWAQWKITFATVASKKEDANISQESYTAKDLAVLEGLDAVRKRPGMYIGSTDSRGLMHCLWEIIDNSVDEALAGHCKKIEINLESDGSVEVDRKSVV